MIDDTELLARYARDGSETAFTELVQRKAGLVYTAALRQVGGDSHLAQEICQNVFVDLARKARQLAHRPVLTSWLYTSTRFAVLKAVRGKVRRQLREQEAGVMQSIENHEPSAADWEKVRPLLDSALCNLAEHDRLPILLRYFEGQSYGQVAAALGITENGARMRADRGIEKLRSVLFQQGVTSTAAALGAFLSTSAVAAPPAGFVATVATTALSKAAIAGTGAGLLAKLSPFTSIHKAPTSYAAFATLGAAGVVSYEVGGDTSSMAFTVYAICFGVGLLFTLLSAITGHIFSGDAEVGHDFDVHGHAQGHAEAGGGDHDMPGFAPLSPTTIATFVTSFGGIGMILQQMTVTRSPWISAPVSAIAALAIAAIVFVVFRMVFQRTQSSSEGRVADLLGHSATVITPILPDSVGEIAYVQSGTRYSAPARTTDGSHLPNGAAVKITRIVGTQFYVTRS